MRSLQDEIVRAVRELKCPICSRSFTLRDIRVQPTLGKGVIELTVSCDKGHVPVVLLVPVNLAEIIEAGPITDLELKKAYKALDKIDHLGQIVRS